MYMYEIMYTCMGCKWIGVQCVCGESYLSLYWMICEVCRSLYVCSVNYLLDFYVTHTHNIWDGKGAMVMGRGKHFKIFSTFYKYFCMFIFCFS